MFGVNILKTRLVTAQLAASQEVFSSMEVPVTLITGEGIEHLLLERRVRIHQCKIHFQG
jgi:hypothetical protein